MNTDPQGFQPTVINIVDRGVQFRSQAEQRGDLAVGVVIVFVTALLMSEHAHDCVFFAHFDGSLIDGHRVGLDLAHVIVR